MLTPIDAEPEEREWVRSGEMGDTAKSIVTPWLRSVVDLEPAGRTREEALVDWRGAPWKIALADTRALDHRDQPLDRPPASHGRGEFGEPVSEPRASREN